MKKKLKSILVVGLLSMILLLPKIGLCGGPVIISGLDTEYGFRPGNPSHGTIAMWAAVINTGILTNVTSCGPLVNPTGNILVIGGGKGPFATDEMTNFWTQIGTTLGRGITFVNGTAIASQSFTGFAMIAVCNTTDGAGKLTAPELSAISLRQGDIANFVNCGGGLFASACDLSPMYGYINIGSPSLVSVVGGGSNSTPTALGTAMGIPNISGPYHNTFSQWPSFLSVLSNLAALPGTTNVRPCILGGKNVTIPSTWVTEIPDGCFCCNNTIYQLPTLPPIAGPSVLSCDIASTFTTMSCPGATITWSVSPSVPFTGQGTSTINITGPYYASSYTITVKIKCGDKVVTNQIVVKPGGCQANPAFSMSSNGGSATFSSTFTSCTHYWFLVKDNDGSCSYTSGDTYVGPIMGNTATFNSLINNQQYTVYHYIFCKCGQYCSSWASQVMCFKWLPAQLMKTANGAKGVEKLKELEINNYKEIPQEFRKDLPKEFQTEVRGVDVRDLKKDIKQMN